MNEKAWGFPDDKRKTLELIFINSNLSEEQKEQIKKLVGDVYVSGLNFKQERPPLGLRPAEFSDKIGLGRMEEIKDALKRCTKANKSIPQKWVDEYNKLCNSIQTVKFPKEIFNKNG